MLPVAKRQKADFCFSVTAKGDFLVVAISHSFELYPKLTIPLTGRR